MTNSKQKGSAGERAAVKHLRSLGYEDARRTVQYNGQSNESKGDIICPESLPFIHFEVKVVKAMRLGNGLFWDAVNQATNEAKKGQEWVLLWREHGRPHWLMTCCGRVKRDYIGLVTLFDSDSQRRMLDAIKDRKTVEHG